MAGSGVVWMVNNCGASFISLLVQGIMRRKNFSRRGLKSGARHLAGNAGNRKITFFCRCLAPYAKVFREQII